MSDVLPGKQKISREEKDRLIMESIPSEMIRKADLFLKQNDFTFFRAESTLSQVSNQFRDKHSIKMKISHLNVLMRLRSKAVCQMYRKKLKPRKHGGDADPAYWDRLKAKAEKMIEYLSMEGVNLGSAERILRTIISTNRTMLQGLPARLRVWEHS